MTELWVEPQDGVVANTTNTQWTEMIGQKFSDAQRVILEQDRDIISTLSTYEHLQVWPLTQFFSVSFFVKNH